MNKGDCKMIKEFNHQNGSYIESNGARIYFEEIGDNTKPVMVMLHGGFGTMVDYNGMTPYLSENFRIIGIDSRGQGKSTLGNPKDLTYQQMSKDTELVLEKLGINKVILIGFSDGGDIGYRMAISSKIKIAKLIAIGSPWHFNNYSEEVKEIFSRITPESWKSKFPQTFEKYENVNPEPDFNKLTDALLGCWTDEKESGYPGENVKKINCPTLLIKGDQDYFFSGESIVQLTNLIEGSLLFVIPNAQHEVYEDQPEILKIGLNQFLTTD